MRLNYIFIVLCFLLNQGLLFAKPFEGKILYQITYQSSIPGITSEQAAGELGSKQELLVKEGNFKFISNGRAFQWRLYNSSDHRFYTKIPNSDTLRFIDASENPYKIQKIDINSSSVKILGFQCSEVTFTTTKGTLTFYYAARPNADPLLYKDCKFACWHDFLVISKAWPLKMEVKEGGLTMTFIASVVTSEMIPKRVIALPQNPSIPLSSYCH